MNLKITRRSAAAALFSLLVLVAFADKEKVVQFFRGGEVIEEYPVSSLDYIEVNDQVSAPTGINAAVDGKKIVVTWDKVDGATYSIYRSADNANYSLLAKGLETNSYTDNAPLSCATYYKVKAISNGVESDFTKAVCAALVDENVETGIYFGITGFNSKLYQYPVHRLSPESMGGFLDFINGLSMSDGTLLYHSFEEGLDALQATTLPSDVTSVAIVTFTDGLDQGSMMMNRNYESDQAYLDAMHRRITDETVSGLAIDAYSIGLRGKDIVNYDKYLNTLKKLASNDKNAAEVTNMGEVKNKLKEIADKMTQQSYLQTVKLKIPGEANGTLIRITFDKVNSAANSKFYVEGKFNLKERSLEEVKYVGCTCPAGETLKGTQDGIFVNFTVSDIKSEQLIEKENINEWTYGASSSAWQKNSEFDQEDNSELVISHTSAAVMFVFDCSSSLAGDFNTAKSQAEEFVKIFYEAYFNEPYIRIDYNGHDYVDLGLPSGLKWATCNVGADSPSDYGDYLAWGEINPKSDYSDSNCKTLYKNISDFSGNPEYDAASARWGGNWRMPTYSELRELRDNCQWAWTMVDGQSGYKVTGPNGNSIFLPAAGYALGSSFNNVGSGGYYWSSTPDESSTFRAYELNFSSSGVGIYSSRRNCGQSVRPVSE